MGKRPGLGAEYRNLIAAYIRKNYGPRSLMVRDEVHIGMSLIGKRRHVDILCVETSSGKALGLECKFQETSGTTDEKIPYALEDLAAMRIPGCLVYAGPGFSRGVIHMLQASSNAVHCLPHPEELAPIANTKVYDPRSFATWELDHVLAMTFGWWDLIPEDDSGTAADDGSGWTNLRAFLLAATTQQHGLARAKKVARAPRQADLPIPKTSKT